MGLRHSLTALVHLGEQVQFEAVPSSEANLGSDFCPMTAVVAWKGKRPNVDLYQLEAHNIDSQKDSIDSTSSSETPEHEKEAFIIIPSTAGNVTGLTRAVGFIATVISENLGVIWWLKRKNYYQSVYFHRRNAFK